MARDVGATPSSLVRHPASWRDPAGFVYRRDGTLLRQVQPAWAEEWQAFAHSALAKRLVESGRLVAWQDAPLDDAYDGSAAAVIRPDVVPFVSYPYEWTFGQLRDAALLTLEVQAAAVAAGWTLKDASAYNVAFRGVTPVLIDHLSFQRLPPDTPWVAYQQFCEHFLAPLALMSRRDVRMGRMLRDQLDGIPARPRGGSAAGAQQAPAGPGGPHPPACAVPALARWRRAQAHGGQAVTLATVRAHREPPGDGAGPALGARGHRVGRLRREGSPELRGRHARCQGGHRADLLAAAGTGAIAAAGTSAPTPVASAPSPPPRAIACSRSTSTRRRPNVTIARCGRPAGPTRRRS
ncbi:MAG: hypothetical protein R3C32_09080 [Chloroflexota bacterium]